RQSLRPAPGPAGRHASTGRSSAASILTPSMALPVQIYSTAQVRQMEAAAVAAGTGGYTLMQRAGAAALSTLRQRWPLARAIAVVAGPGNNGGDGLVLARLAQQAGLAVDVMLVGEAGKLRGEAKQAHA